MFYNHRHILFQEGYVNVIQPETYPIKNKKNFRFPCRCASEGQQSTECLHLVVWKTTPRGIEWQWCYTNVRFVLSWLSSCDVHEDNIFNRGTRQLLIPHSLRQRIIQMVSLLVQVGFIKLSWWIIMALVTTKSLFYLEDVQVWMFEFIQEKRITEVFIPVFTMAWENFSRWLINMKTYFL